MPALNPHRNTPPLAAAPTRKQPAVDVHTEEALRAFARQQAMAFQAEQGDRLGAARVAKKMAFLVVAAALFMQYYFYDVVQQIIAMPTIVVNLHPVQQKPEG